MYLISSLGMRATLISAIFCFILSFSYAQTTGDHHLTVSDRISTERQAALKLTDSIKHYLKTKPNKAHELFHRVITQYGEQLTTKEKTSLMLTMSKSMALTHTFLARQLAERAWHMLRENGKEFDHLNAAILDALGFTYLAEGAFDKAINPYTKSLKYTLEAEPLNAMLLQKAYSNLAMSYNFLQNADSALKYSRLALKTVLKDTSNNPEGEASNYGNFSRALALKGKIDSAIMLRQKSLEINKELFGPKAHKTATSYYYLGNLYFMKGEAEKGLNYVEKCMLTNFPDEGLDHDYHYLPPNLGNHTNTSGVLQPLMLKIDFFEILFAQNKDATWLKLALNHYKAMDTLVNILQQSQTEENLPRLMAINKAGYEEAIKLAWQLKQIDSTYDYRNEIYDFASATKGWLLSYQMHKTKSSNSLREANSMETELEKELREIQNQAQVTSGSDKDSLELLMLAKKTKLIGIKNTIKSQSEQGAGVDLNRFNISLEEIRKNLNEHEALIEYTEAGEYLNIFCSTASETVVKRIEKDEDFNSAYRDFLRGIKTGSTKMKYKLTQYLVEPIYNQLAHKQNLIIIPDNILHNIPFEALNIPGENREMINDHAITYHYSARLWADSRRNVEEREELAVTLFAPGFMKEEYAELAGNNTYRSLEVLAEEGIINLNEWELVSLPHSIHEVEAIDEMFGINGFKTQMITGAEATEENFRQLPSSRILHVATHGVSSKDNPAFSGLFFSQPEKVSKQHDKDGFLFVNELFSMQLNTDLVVLSACKSGTGKILEGEGVFALPRGFIFAGVPNLIASLWKVHDEKTKDLITAFYSHLLKGDSYSDALRQAKLEMIEKGELPLDWSGIVLIGR
ncbi:MAG: CHAT domain-containing protein [Bacteroidales bacterium]|nr:CHAT domain-containing protein [Bacteroidales bacterium]